MLDFLQRRQPFVEEAMSVLDLALYGVIQGIIPAHGLTTIHYLLHKSLGPDQAMEAVTWMLSSFGIAPCTETTLRRATALGMLDFEDAVVAAMAENMQCDYIITRNVSDFCNSPVRALRPGELLAL